MALRTIRTDDDPCLYKVCKPVEKFDGRLAQLIDDLYETMDAADGAGLAAPQGSAASKNAAIAMQKRGIEIGLHRAAQLTLAKVDQADLVLTMTERHKASILHEGSQWKSKKS